MSSFEHEVAGLARGSAFLLGVIVFVPLILFHYLAAVLTASGVPGA